MLSQIQTALRINFLGTKRGLNLKKERMSVHSKTKVALAVTALVGTLALGTSLATNQASAYRGSDSSGSFAQSIAQRFNLDETNVTAFMKEHKQARKEAHLQEKQARLGEAVTNGIITQDQKDALLSKMEEHKSSHDADKSQWKELSHEERREMKDAHHSEMEEWAQSQGIDLDAIHEFIGEHHGKKHGHHRGNSIQ